MPRAPRQSLGSDALDSDVEDDHDPALAAAEVAARKGHEAEVALGNWPSGGGSS